jgi:hypothetical protein
VGPGGARQVAFHTGRSADGNRVQAIVAVSRVDAAGVVRDATAVELGLTWFTYEANPSVAEMRLAAAWTGDGYLVVWIGNEGVVGRVVPLDGPPGPLFTIATGTIGTRWPSVACGPAECLVAWWTFEASIGHRVRLARVRGSTVAQGAFLATTASGDQHEPAVVWTGSQYLVAWRDIRRPDGGDVYGARVSAAGAVLDPAGFMISAGAGTESQVALDWTGTEALVSWLDTRSGAGEIWGARVTADGRVASPAARLAANAASDGPTVAWNGAAHLVAWRASDGLRALRVSAAGAPDPAGDAVLVATATGRPELASADGAHELVWTDGARLPQPSVLLRRIPAAGAAAPDVVPALAPSNETHPALASDGDRFLLAWTDTRHGWTTVHASRFDANGRALDREGMRVSPATAGVHRKLAALAWGGGAYLCAWIATSPGSLASIEAVRISAEGVVLDATPIVLATGLINIEVFARPSIAWSGAHWLVVWGTQRGIEGARVDALGRALDPSARSMQRAPNREARIPTVVWTGAAYFVVWDNKGYYGMRVGADGALLDATDTPIAGHHPAEIYPALASNGRGLLLLSSDRTSRTVFAQRFDVMGAPVGAPIPVSDSNEPQYPSVAWDGRNWIMAWTSSAPSGAAPRTLQVHRMTEGGRLIYPAPEPDLAPNPGAPYIASNASDRTAMFWVRAYTPDAANASAVYTHISGIISNCEPGACPEPLPTPDAGAPPADVPPAAVDGGRSTSGGGGARGCGVTPRASGVGGGASAVMGLLLALACVRRRRDRRP